VVAWGRNDYGQANVPAGLTGVTAIAGGLNHTVALKNDGTVVAWGRNDYGQTNVPSGLSGVTAIAAGAEHTVALYTPSTPANTPTNTPVPPTNTPLPTPTNTPLPTPTNTPVPPTNTPVPPTNTPTNTPTSGPVYQFRGFFAPVDDAPIFNQMKAGRAVPIKFSLGGDFGLNIFAAGFPKSQQMNCNPSASSDSVEVTLSVSGSSLSYDASTRTYTYVWKTEKSWAGTCRQVIMQFNNGTTQHANFNFQ